MQIKLPVIDRVATGKNIKRLRIEHGYSVKDLKDIFLFESVQAIYKWEWGNPPGIDNMLALSELFGISVNEILVTEKDDASLIDGQSDASDCPFLKIVFYTNGEKNALFY